MKAPLFTPRRRLVRLAVTLALVYVACMGLLSGCQRHLIYFPHRAPLAEMRQQAARMGLEAWEDADGQVIGWRAARAEGTARPAARLLVFHGNAGSAVHRAYFRDGFAAVNDGATWEVTILEYPGYGARTGKPGETSLTEAAGAALAQLWREDDRPVFVLGESLGSGVACRMAGDFPDRVTGVFLITPFTQLGDVGSHHYPFLPVRLILRDRYDNVNALQRYHGPAAVLIAGQDEVIPADLGRRLHDGYAGPKRLWEQPGARHNGLDYRPRAAWWREVSAFLLQNEMPEAK